MRSLPSFVLVAVAFRRIDGRAGAGSGPANPALPFEPLRHGRRGAGTGRLKLLTAGGLLGRRQKFGRLGGTWWRRHAIGGRETRDQQRSTVTRRPDRRGIPEAAASDRRQGRGLRRAIGRGIAVIGVLATGERQRGERHDNKAWRGAVDQAAG